MYYGHLYLNLTSAFLVIKNTIKKNILLGITIMILSCKKEQSQPQFFYKEPITPNDIETITPEEAKTFHKNPQREYEYRTGTFNNYEYDYDIVGTDEKQNPVTGNIIVKGKYGAGILESETEKDIEVQVEWTGYGKLKGTDQKGRSYTLEIATEK